MTGTAEIRVEPAGSMTTASPVRLQIAVEAEGWPPESGIQALAEEAVGAVFDELGIEPHPGTELSFLFADNEAIRQMNRQWRGIDKPTNVLSFPAVEIVNPEVLPAMLGDIALAFETVASEAELESKPFNHHLVHLIVHGLLHLVGYDHGTDNEALQMESLETAILARLAIPDPYAMMHETD